mmetsp:Transcript_48340/g.95400  ORF Transcript_48340/g.95400 Transcript_48340/m.95400 type:complete len:114 (-) Transcript_48340:130-471(-)
MTSLFLLLRSDLPPSLPLPPHSPSGKHPSRLAGSRAVRMHASCMQQQYYESLVPTRRKSDCSLTFIGWLAGFKKSLGSFNLKELNGLTAMRNRLNFLPTGCGWKKKRGDARIH